MLRETVVENNTPKQNRRSAKLAARQRKKRIDRIISVAAFVAIAAAWLFGYFRAGSDIAPRVPQVLASAERVEQRGSVFYGYASDDGNETLVGYAGTGEATGYAGPIQVLVGVDTEGQIVGVQVLEHRETPGFFRRLYEQTFFEQFLGRNYASNLSLGGDLDAVSGATISSEAVARAIREEVRALGSGPIGAEVPAASEPIQFGAPEVLLIALYTAGYVGHRSRNPKGKRWVRRGTLAAGAIGLGFMYNKPLTVANFISLLSGYWPDWHTNLYWFLLLGGVLFVTTAQAKNPYCSWFCPFGAVQEGLGRIGGAKLFYPRRWRSHLQWFQRGLALSAIVLGLALRQPGPASYEPFGTLFEFTGHWAQWVLLAMVLLGSLVVLRPFCNYLCPLDPIVDYIGEGRRLAQDTVRKVRS